MTDTEISFLGNKTSVSSPPSYLPPDDFSLEFPVMDSTCIVGDTRIESPTISFDKSLLCKARDLDVSSFQYQEDSTLSNGTVSDCNDTFNRSLAQRQKDTNFFKKPKIVGRRSIKIDGLLNETQVDSSDSDTSIVYTKVRFGLLSKKAPRVSSSALDKAAESSAENSPVVDGTTSRVSFKSKKNAYLKKKKVSMNFSNFPDLDESDLGTSDNNESVSNVSRRKSGRKSEVRFMEPETQKVEVEDVNEEALDDNTTCVKTDSVVSRRKSCLKKVSKFEMDDFPGFDETASKTSKNNESASGITYRDRRRHSQVRFLNHNTTPEGQGLPEVTNVPDEKDCNLSSGRGTLMGDSSHCSIDSAECKKNESPNEIPLHLENCEPHLDARSVSTIKEGTDSLLTAGNKEILMKKCDSKGTCYENSTMSTMGISSPLSTLPSGDLSCDGPVEDSQCVSRETRGERLAPDFDKSLLCGAGTLDVPSDPLQERLKLNNSPSDSIGTSSMNFSQSRRKSNVLDEPRTDTRNSQVRFSSHNTTPEGQGLPEVTNVPDEKDSKHTQQKIHNTLNEALTVDLESDTSKNYSKAKFSLTSSLAVPSSSKIGESSAVEAQNEKLDSSVLLNDTNSVETNLKVHGFMAKPTSKKVSLNINNFTFLDETECETTGNSESLSPISHQGSSQNSEEKSLEREVAPNTQQLEVENIHEEVVADKSSGHIQLVDAPISQRRSCLKKVSMNYNNIPCLDETQCETTSNSETVSHKSLKGIRKKSEMRFLEEEKPLKEQVLEVRHLENVVLDNSTNDESITVQANSFKEKSTSKKVTLTFDNISCLDKTQCETTTNSQAVSLKSQDKLKTEMIFLEEEDQFIEQREDRGIEEVGLDDSTGNASNVAQAVEFRTKYTSKKVSLNFGNFSCLDETQCESTINGESMSHISHRHSRKISEVEFSDGEISSETQELRNIQEELEADRSSDEINLVDAPIPQRKSCLKKVSMNYNNIPCLDENQCETTSNSDTVSRKSLGGNRNNSEVRFLEEENHFIDQREVRGIEEVGLDNSTSNVSNMAQAVGFRTKFTSKKVSLNFGNFSCLDETQCESTSNGESVSHISHRPSRNISEAKFLEDEISSETEELGDIHEKVVGDKSSAEIELDDAPITRRKSCLKKVSMNYNNDPCFNENQCETTYDSETVSHKSLGGKRKKSEVRFVEEEDHFIDQSEVSGIEEVGLDNSTSNASNVAEAVEFRKKSTSKKVSLNFGNFSCLDETQCESTSNGDSMSHISHRHSRRISEVKFLDNEISSETEELGDIHEKVVGDKSSAEIELDDAPITRRKSCLKKVSMNYNNDPCFNENQCETTYDSETVSHKSLGGKRKKSEVRFVEEEDHFIDQSEVSGIEEVGLDNSTSNASNVAEAVEFRKKSTSKKVSLNFGNFSCLDETQCESTSNGDSMSHISHRHSRRISEVKFLDNEISPERQELKNIQEELEADKSSDEINLVDAPIPQRKSCLKKVSMTFNNIPCLDENQCESTNDSETVSCKSIEGNRKKSEVRFLEKEEPPKEKVLDVRLIEKAVSDNSISDLSNMAQAVGFKKKSILKKVSLNLSNFSYLDETQCETNTNDESMSDISHRHSRNNSEVKLSEDEISSETEELGDIHEKVVGDKTSAVKELDDAPITRRKSCLKKVSMTFNNIPCLDENQGESTTDSETVSCKSLERNRKKSEVRFLEKEEPPKGKVLDVRLIEKAVSDNSISDMSNMAQAVGFKKKSILKKVSLNFGNLSYLDESQCETTTNDKSVSHISHRQSRKISEAKFSVDEISPETQELGGVDKSSGEINLVDAPNSQRKSCLKKVSMNYNNIPCPDENQRESTNDSETVSCKSLEGNRKKSEVRFLEKEELPKEKVLDVRLIEKAVSDNSISDLSNMAQAVGFKKKSILKKVSLNFSNFSYLDESQCETTINDESVSHLTHRHSRKISEAIFSEDEISPETQELGGIQEELEADKSSDEINLADASISQRKSCLKKVSMNYNNDPCFDENQRESTNDSETVSCKSLEGNRKKSEVRFLEKEEPPKEKVLDVRLIEKAVLDNSISDLSNMAQAVGFKKKSILKKVSLNFGNLSYLDESQCETTTNDESVSHISHRNSRNISKAKYSEDEISPETQELGGIQEELVVDKSRGEMNLTDAPVPHRKSCLKKVSINFNNVTCLDETDCETTCNSEMLSNLSHRDNSKKSEVRFSEGKIPSKIEESGDGYIQEEVLADTTSGDIRKNSCRNEISSDLVDLPEESEAESKTTNSSELLIPLSHQISKKNLDARNLELGFSEGSTPPKSQELEVGEDLGFMKRTSYKDISSNDITEMGKTESQTTINSEPFSRIVDQDRRNNSQVKFIDQNTSLEVGDNQEKKHRDQSVDRDDSMNVYSHSTTDSNKKSSLNKVSLKHMDCEPGSMATAGNEELLIKKCDYNITCNENLSTITPNKTSKQKGNISEDKVSVTRNSYLGKTISSQQEQIPSDDLSLDGPLRYTTHFVSDSKIENTLPILKESLFYKDTALNVPSLQIEDVEKSNTAFGRSIKMNLTLNMSEDPDNSLLYSSDRLSLTGRVSVPGLSLVTDGSSAENSASAPSPVSSCSTESDHEKISDVTFAAETDLLEKRSGFMEKSSLKEISLNLTHLPCLDKTECATNTDNELVCEKSHQDSKKNSQELLEDIIPPKRKEFHDGGIQDEELGEETENQSNEDKGMGTEIFQAEQTSAQVDTVQKISDDEKERRQVEELFLCKEKEDSEVKNKLDSLPVTKDLPEKELMISKVNELMSIKESERLSKAEQVVEPAIAIISTESVTPPRKSENREECKGNSSKVNHQSRRKRETIENQSTDELGVYSEADKENTSDKSISRSKRRRISNDSCPKVSVADSVKPVSDMNERDIRREKSHQDSKKNSQELLEDIIPPKRKEFHEGGIQDEELGDNTSDETENQSNEDKGMGTELFQAEQTSAQTDTVQKISDDEKERRQVEELFLCKEKEDSEVKNKLDSLPVTKDLPEKELMISKVNELMSIKESERLSKAEQVVEPAIAIISTESVTPPRKSENREECKGNSSKVNRQSRRKRETIENQSTDELGEYSEADKENASDKSISRSKRRRISNDSCLKVSEADSVKPVSDMNERDIRRNKNSSTSFKVLRKSSIMKKLVQSKDSTSIDNVNQMSLTVTSSDKENDEIAAIVLDNKQSVSEAQGVQERGRETKVQSRSSRKSNLNQAGSQIDQMETISVIDIVGQKSSENWKIPENSIKMNGRMSKKKSSSPLTTKNSKEGSGNVLQPFDDTEMTVFAQNFSLEVSAIPPVGGKKNKFGSKAHSTPMVKMPKKSPRLANRSVQVTKILVDSNELLTSNSVAKSKSGEKTVQLSQTKISTRNFKDVTNLTPKRALMKHKTVTFREILAESIHISPTISTSQTSLDTLSPPECSSLDTTISTSTKIRNLKESSSELPFSEDTQTNNTISELIPCSGISTRSRADDYSKGSRGCGKRQLNFSESSVFDAPPLSFTSDYSSNSVSSKKKRREEEDSFTNVNVSAMNPPTSDLLNSDNTKVKRRKTRSKLLLESDSTTVNKEQTAHNILGTDRMTKEKNNKRTIQQEEVWEENSFSIIKGSTMDPPTPESSPSDYRRHKKKKPRVQVLRETDSSVTCWKKKDSIFGSPIEKKSKKKESNKDFTNDPDFYIDGKPYRQKPLFRPAKWITMDFYKYLWSKFKPVYGLKSRITSTQFMVFLYSKVILVEHDCQDIAIHSRELKQELSRLGLCFDYAEYLWFLMNWTPDTFYTPMLNYDSKMGVSFTDPIV